MIDKKILKDCMNTFPSQFGKVAVIISVAVGSIHIWVETVRLKGTISTTCQEGIEREKYNNYIIYLRRLKINKIEKIKNAQKTINDKCS